MVYKKLLTWIKSFVSNRVQQVVVDGQQSNLAAVSSGVPQGTVLAPLLFLCFINDLPNGIMSKIKWYADDILLYTTFTHKNIATTYNRIWIHSKSGQLNGKWHSICKNVNFSGSPTKIPNLCSIFYTEWNNQGGNLHEISRSDNWSEFEMVGAC